MTDLHKDVELIDPDDLIPYSNNPKEHPDEQIKKIASSIKNYGWDQPIVIDEENEIIKGHGRLQAAQLLDLDEVPVIRRKDLSESEAKAARIADNKTAESEWDDNVLAVELDALLDVPEIDMDSTGFDEDELDDLLDSLGEEQQETDIDYTDKIKTPVYEPTGEKPDLTDLYDTSRYEELLEKVEAADVSEDKREFLRFAAQRHIVFNYENIAEFFAHESPEVQELMEALTLVIVDYEQAIEQGYVTFAEDVLSEAESDA